jgi:transposase
MIQITPQMRILVAIEPTDFRRGIDGLARVCKEVLRQDPFDGCVFVFRNRPATALKILVYDGQGFWLCHKRLSRGHFGWWPTRAVTDPADPCPPSVDGAHAVSAGARALAAHQLQVLLAAGNPQAVQAAPAWRPLRCGA